MVYMHFEPSLDVKTRAIDIAYIEIEDYFGDKTALLYKEFFLDKDDKTILSLLEALLIEVIGDKKAEEKMKHIQNILAI